MSEDKEIQFNSFETGSSEGDDKPVMPVRRHFDESTMKEIDNPYQSVHTDEGKAENPSVEAAGVKSEESNIQKAEAPVSPASPASADKKAVRRSGSGLRRLVLIVAILVFIGSAAVIVKFFVDKQQHIRNNEDMANKVEQLEDNTAVGADGIFEKYRDLYNQNHDFVGWIKIPNTTINHPVVKAPDNDYYLRRNFTGSHDRRGTVFMDYRDHVDVLCKNTILYGHNNLDSTMFSDLDNYKNIEFYKTAPVIEFNTIYHNYKWKIISVFYTNAEDKDDNDYALNYIYPFMTDESFEKYVYEITVRSLYFPDVDVVKTDKILTLSTCTRDMDIKGQGETNARFVIVARMVRDGESDEVNVNAVVKNPQPRYPQIWYDKYGQVNPYKDAERWFPEGVEY